MKIIILSARILAAARLFQAKNDPRTYLKGVRVEKHRIAGCNGHTLFYMPNINPFFNETNTHYNDKGFNPTTEFEPFTINISGIIPAKAEQAALIFLDDDSGYIEYFGYTKRRNFGKLDEKTFFNLVPGNYPDIDHVIGKFVNKPVSAFGLCPTYLSYVEKSCAILSGKNHHKIRVLTSDSYQPLRFEHESRLVTATATILIMPMNL